ncbi:MAG: CBS domain-containing protein [Saprospiraceae bacterium]
MGTFNIKQIENLHQRNHFYKEIFDDIEIFDQMLEQGLIDHSDHMIGVEQELCLINSLGEPQKTALNILEDIKAKQYTNELALFNLEINLDPQPLVGNGLQDIAYQLYSLVEKGRKVASKYDTELFVTGILPTLCPSDLTFQSMTPIDRYKVLSQELLKLRGEKFEIYLQGVDDLNLKLDTILFEACNTSIQLHMQINPDRFVHFHNWAQLISGPVLACCSNSPILFGKELWSENRIALFKQSLDTRIHYNHYREKTPRVYFGNNWLHTSPSELWKNEVARFPLVFRGEGFPNAKEQWQRGEIPELRSIRLHNGTTYTWNRLCYGVDSGKSHLRIECRYLPAGPTLVDELANLVFWVGLMKAGEYQEEKFWDNIEFASAKSNFYKAARTGILTEFDIFGKNMAASKLCTDILLPLCQRALSDQGVEKSIIEKYTGNIANRVENRQTGATWMTENFRRLNTRFKPSLVSKILVTESLQYQKEDVPVSEWDNILEERLHFFFHKSFQNLKAKDIMSHKIQAIGEETSVLFALNIMKWQGIHHLIVEDNKEIFKGVIHQPDLEKVEDQNVVVKSFITAHFYKVHSDTPLAKIQTLIRKKEGMAVIVVEKNKTVGIITENDL